MVVEKTLDRLKTIGGRFGFEMFLEVFHDDIVEAAHLYLKKITPGKIPKMVEKGKYPQIDPIVFQRLHPYERFIEKLSVVRLTEVVAEAHPSLYKAIEALGVDGATYMVKFRAHLIDLVKNPEKALAKSRTYRKSKVKMVKATCDVCNRSWPVPEDEFQSIDKCPFCGVGKNEPAPPEENP